MGTAEFCETCHEEIEEMGDALNEDDARAYSFTRQQEGAAVIDEGGEEIV